MPRLSAIEKENLSANLHLLLEKYHMSIPYAALSCGIPLRTFESYYYCEKSPSIKNLTQIANFFLLTPTALISEKLPDKESKMKGSKKMLEDKRAYYEVKKLLENDSQTDLVALLNHKFDDIHLATIQMFKDLGFQVDFIPTFTYDDLENYLMDDFNLKSYKEYSELYDKRFEVSPDASDDVLEDVERLKKALAPEREKYLLEHVGLTCVLNYISQDKYKSIEDIPLKVRFSTVITNLKPKETNSPTDLLAQPKEYNLADLFDLEEQLTDILFDFLEK